MKIGNLVFFLFVICLGALPIPLHAVSVCEFFFREPSISYEQRVVTELNSAFSRLRSTVYVSPSLEAALRSANSNAQVTLFIATVGEFRSLGLKTHQANYNGITLDQTAVAPIHIHTLGTTIENVRREITKKGTVVAVGLYESELHSYLSPYYTLLNRVQLVENPSVVEKPRGSRKESGVRRYNWGDESRD